MVAVDLAPDALRPSRREALQERRVVERLSNGIDPAPAERNVERLGMRNGRKSGSFLVDLDPDLGLRVVVRAQPRFERIRVSEGLGSWSERV